MTIGALTSKKKQYNLSSDFCNFCNFYNCTQRFELWLRKLESVQGTAIGASKYVCSIWSSTVEYFTTTSCECSRNSDLSWLDVRKTFAFSVRKKMLWREIVHTLIFQAFKLLILKCCLSTVTPQQLHVFKRFEASQTYRRDTICNLYEAWWTLLLKAVSPRTS